MLIAIALYLLIGFVIMVFVRRYENKNFPLEYQTGMTSDFWACVVFWIFLAIFVIGINIVAILETIVFVQPKE